VFFVTTLSKGYLFFLGAAFSAPAIIAAGPMKAFQTAMQAMSLFQAIDGGATALDGLATGDYDKATGGAFDVAFGLAGVGALGRLGDAIDAAEWTILGAESAAAFGEWAGALEGNCFVEGTAVALADGTTTAPVEALISGALVRTSGFGEAQPSSGELKGRSDLRRVRLSLVAGDCASVVTDFGAELLRPQSWLMEEGAEAGSEIWLDLGELGAPGVWRVESVDEAPPIHGDGRVVTGIIRGMSDQIFDIGFVGFTSPLGVTAEHPLWSESRGTWVAAGALTVGEIVRTISGFAEVESVQARPGPAQRVWTLEVEGEHVFFAGDVGVLAHNGSFMRRARGLRRAKRNEGILPKAVSRTHQKGLRNYKGERVYVASDHVMSPRDPRMDAPPLYREGPFSSSQRDLMLKGLAGEKGVAPHHRHQIAVRDGGVIDELPGPGHIEGNQHTAGTPTRHPGPSAFNRMAGRSGQLLRAKEIREYWKHKGQRLVEVQTGIWMDPGVN
ncbi:MAG: Hint domain-containing protein, partial [Sumerlaeia bacterium]